MIIAFALSENRQECTIDMHFGRCNWYGIYDTGTRESIFVENPNQDNEEGAGCDSAKMLLDYKINAVAAGRFGSKVVDFFSQHSIQMIVTRDNQTFGELINKIKL